MSHEDLESLAYDDPARFLAAVRPLVDVTSALADAIQVLLQRYEGVPAEHSPGMREIAEEEQLPIRTETWARPVTDAHAHASFLAIACLENLRCYGRLFSETPAPLYSYLVLGRATIETGVYAHWLNAPDITAHQRVQRLLVEQLHAQRERARIPPLRSGARDRQRQLQQEATAFGWSCGGREPEVGGIGRPRVKSAINQLMGFKPEDHFGALMYGWLSGAVHGGLDTLLLSVQPAEPSVPRIDGLQSAEIGVSSREVGMVSVVVLEVALAAVDAWMRLLGWAAHDPAAAQARVDAGELVQVLRKANGWPPSPNQQPSAEA